MIASNRWTRFIAAALVAGGALLSPTAFAQPEQELVERARRTLDNFVKDPDMRWLRENAGQTHAILIVPEMLKLGVVIGGAAGTGVAFRRDAQTGQWGGPVFFTLAAGSFGLQLGAQVSEVLLLMMNERGARQLLANSFKLGPDASVAAGPVGVGTSVAPISDIVSFSRSQGLFAGISLEGTILSPRDEWNNAYYGSGVRVEDVFAGRKVAPKGSTVRAEVQKAMHGPK